MYISTYIPSLWTSLPPTYPLTHLGHNRALSCIAPCAIQQVPTGYLFYTWQCIYVNAPLPIHPTLCFPPSPPAPRVHSLLLHFYSCPASRFICTIFLDSTYVLIYDICFSLSDLIYKQVMHLNIKRRKQSNQKMGRRPKQTFLQKRHTDGQEAHKNMLHITSYQTKADPGAPLISLLFLNIFSRHHSSAVCQLPLFFRVSTQPAFLLNMHNFPTPSLSISFLSPLPNDLILTNGDQIYISGPIVSS